MKPGILHIVDSFGQGGTERQAVQLVRMLNNSGRYQVHLACLQKQGALLGEAEALGLGSIAEYPLTSFYDRNFVTQVRRLVKFLKQHDVAMVHSHDFYTNIFGMIAGALARVPARVASKRETSGFRSPLQLRAERVAYSLSHAVVVNAEAVGRQLTAAGVSPEKIVTIHNGLNPERVIAKGQRREALAHLGLPTETERRFVTIVANLQHEVKDHPTFLRAAAQIRTRSSNAAFLIAGEGKLRERLSLLTKELGLESEVFFLGRCDRMAELLSVSDVCVLSSKAEGFSNSILEYMAAARPVVATNVGGVREVVVEGETGYIVSAGDAEGMAQRVIELLSDPDRARAMGERGRVIVGEKFSCEAQLDRTVALYDRLLSRALQTLPPPVQNLRRESA